MTNHLNRASGSLGEALSSGFRKAIAGLGPSDQANLKPAFGRVMGEVVSVIINPAIAAFPDCAGGVQVRLI